jgi:hypothetical protein
MTQITIKTESKKRRGSIKYPLSGNNPALGILPESFWQEMQLGVNRAKGKSYEKLTTSLIVDSLKEKLDTSKFTILTDKEWFYCFEENTCKRRYDIFIKELLVSYEIKSYRVIYNSFVREQIQKDKWLLDNKKVNEVRWILFNGATQNVLKALTQNKIMYLDVTGNENNYTNIPQIYQEINGSVYTPMGIPVIPL